MAVAFLCPSFPQKMTHSPPHLDDFKRPGYKNTAERFVHLGSTDSGVQSVLAEAKG